MDHYVVVIRTQDAFTINNTKNDFHTSIYGQLPREKVKKWKVRLINAVIPAPNGQVDGSINNEILSEYIEVRCSLGRDGIVDNATLPLIGILNNQTVAVTNDLSRIGADARWSYSYSFIVNSPNLDDVHFQYIDLRSGNGVTNVAGVLEDSVIILSFTPLE